MNAPIIEQPFMPKCYSNSDQTSEEWYAWISEKLDSNTQRRTQHRRIISPWIIPDTSNLIDRFSTIKKVYEKQPHCTSKRNLSE